MMVTNFFFDFLHYYFLFNITFYVSNLILYFIDTRSILAENKLQTQSVDLIYNTYKKCLSTALLNTFVYNIPAVFMMIPVVNWYGFDFSWTKTLFDLAMSYIMMDFFYFVTHRLLHTKYLYVYHKKHHEILAPVGLSATYLTIVDFYSNVLSIYLPLVLLSADSTTTSLWIIISTLNTIFIGHSGYSPIASFHDNHHKYFNCNYGVGVFADRLFGTIWKENK